ncbi:MAG: hypothetical protein V3V85_00610 [Candidatus Thorarchaeota archaeon]
MSDLKELGPAVGKLDYREYRSQRKGKACARLLFVRDRWSQLGVVDNFRTLEWPKPEILEALYARREETFGLSACRHAQAASGYLAPWTYINREVRLPEPVVDLAPESAYHCVLQVTGPAEV